MGGKYLLLLLENWSYFLLESEKLFFVSVHSSFHSADVFLYFLFLLSFRLLVLDLFGYPVVVLVFLGLGLDLGLFDRDHWFLYWSCSWFLFLFHWQRLFLFWVFFWNWWVSRDRHLWRLLLSFVMGWCYSFWSCFLLIFRLNYLFLILQIIFLLMYLLFFQIISTLYFNNIFFSFQTIFIFRFSLTLIILSIILINLCIFLTHFSLILQSLSISKGIKTMISWWTSRWYTCYHHNFACLVFVYKWISKN